MNLLVEKFIDILVSEKAVHNELLELAIQKKDVLIKNDIDTLNNIVSKETEIVSLNTELENTREALVKDIAQKNGINKEVLSLDEVAELCEIAQKLRIKKLKSELGDIVSKLIDYNNINKELLKTHLNYTFFSLNVMAQGMTAADTYDGSGYMKDDRKSLVGLVDQKA